MNKFISLLLSLFVALPAYGAGPVIWGARGAQNISSGPVYDRNVPYIKQPTTNYIANQSGAINTTGWAGSGTATVTRVTSGLPRETTVGAGLSLAAGAVNDYVQSCWTIDTSDLNTKLSWSWSQAPASYAAGDFVAQVYSFEGDNCTSTEVQLNVSPVASGQDYSIANYTGAQAVTFDTTDATYYGIRYTRKAGTSTLVVSNVIVGPGTIVPIPAIGNWQSYTPTGSWANTTYTGKYRRVGSQMEVYARATLTGTPTATILTFSIPSGFTIDTSVLLGTVANNAVLLGSATGRQGSGGFRLAVNYSSTTTVSITYQSTTAAAASGVTSTVPVSWVSADWIEAAFTVPIAEWAGAPNYAGQNDVEYAFNTSGLTTANASDTTSFGYGPAGAAIGSIASTTNGATEMRVRFLTPIQATDSILLQAASINNVNAWTTVGTTTLPGRYQAQGSARYGMGTQVINTTDVDVLFGNNGARSTNASYAGNGDAWSNYSTFRWRLVKARAGAAVGFGVAGDDTNVGLTTKNITSTVSVTASATQALGASPAKVTLNSTDIAVTLPTSGTYLVMGIVHVDPTSAAGDLTAKLYNSTDAADVAGSNRIYYMAAAETYVPVDLSAVVTVSGSKTIQFFAWRDAGLAAANAVSGASTVAKLTYIRLY